MKNTFYFLLALGGMLVTLVGSLVVVADTPIVGILMIVGGIAMLVAGINIERWWGKMFAPASSYKWLQQASVED